MVTIGEMDCLVTLRRWSWLKNGSGGLRKVNTSAWPLWMNVIDKGGSSNTENQQMTWTVRKVFTGQYERDHVIAVNDTVDYDGQRFAIESIKIEGQGNRQQVEIETLTTGALEENNLSTMLDVVDYTGVGTETSINLPVLYNKAVKLAFKDGVEFKVIEYPAALDTTQKQVQFRASTGDLVWTVPFILNENAKICFADL